MMDICRLCGSEKCVIDLVIELKEKTNKNIQFKQLVENFCQIELDPNKLLPQSVCQECRSLVETFAEFTERVKITQSEIKLRRYYDETSRDQEENSLAFVGKHEGDVELGDYEENEQEISNSSDGHQSSASTFNEISDYEAETSERSRRKTLRNKTKKRNVQRIDKRSALKSADCIAKSFEELFKNELNGHSELTMAHLCVPKETVLSEGAISDEGLKMISNLRWTDLNMQNVIESNHFENLSMSCTLCASLELKSLTSYVNHMCSKHYDHLRYCCISCSVMFYDLPALWNHQITAHPELRKLFLVCLHCGFLGAGLHDLKSHRAFHINHEFNDNYVTYKKVFDTELNGDLFKSKYNLAISDDLKNLDGTVRSDQDQSCSKWSEFLHDCRECSEEKLSIPEFYLHIETNHAETKGSKYICSVCGEGMNQIQSYLLHMSRHDRFLNYSCFVCNQSFWNYGAIQRHYSECHHIFKVIMCSFCGNFFRDFQRCLEHAAGVHGASGIEKSISKLRPIKRKQIRKIKSIKIEAPTGQRHHRVSGCKAASITKKVEFEMLKESRTIEELFDAELNGNSMFPLYHLPCSEDLKESNGSIKDENLTMISNVRWNGLKYSCQCGVQLTSCLSLKLHMDQHNNESYLQCQYCENGGAKTIFGYLNHMSNKHYEHLKLCCPLCSIMFYDVISLWAHVLQNHPEIKRIRKCFIPCYICGHFTDSLKNLKIHKTMHINQDSMKSYIWFKNNFSAEMNTDIRKSKHLLAISEYDRNDDGSVKDNALVKYPKWNELSLRCEECDISLSPIEFQLHQQNSHPDARGSKFFCHCGSGFGQFQSYVNHQFLKHDPRLSYCCLNCSQVFWSYVALHNHYAACHFATRAYICLICGNHFREVHQINSHVSVHGIKPYDTDPITEALSLQAITRKDNKKFKNRGKGFISAISSQFADVGETLDFPDFQIKKEMEDENEPEESKSADEDEAGGEDEYAIENSNENSLAGSFSSESMSSDESSKRSVKKRKLESKSNDVARSYDELFCDELNGKSRFSLICHLNILKDLKLPNGEISRAGLSEIQGKLWNEMIFKCSGSCKFTCQSPFDLKYHCDHEHSKTTVSMKCPECTGPSFSDINSLISHVTGHFEALMFCCILCSKLFYDMTSLWKHYRASHRNNGDVKKLFPCIYCGAYKSNLKELISHKDDHVKLENSENVRKFREFFKNELSLELTQSICNLKLYDFERLPDGTMIKEAEGRFVQWNALVVKCPVCPVTVNSSYDLHKHQIEEHPEKKPTFPCPMGCSEKTYNKMTVYANHMASAHYSHLYYCCTICSKMFWNFVALNNHYRECHTQMCSKIWICLYCGSQYPTISSALSHLSYHRNKITINGERKYRCQCSQIFSYLETYNAHDCPFKNDKPSTSATAQFICHICAKTFVNSSTLNNHVQTHQRTEASELWECDICGKRMKSKYILKTHKITHSEKSFICHCGASFHYKGALQRHQMIHTGDKPFCCKVCDKRFASKSDMIIHERLHSGDYPYVCPVSGCNDKYPSWSNLYKHTISRHKIDIKEQGYRLSNIQNIECESD